MGMLIIGTLAALSFVVHLGIRFWPRTGERRTQRGLIAYYAQARRAGMTPAHTQQELRLRTAMARLRRVASDRVHDRPLGYETIIANAALDEAKALASIDKAASRSFVSWVETAALDEILYPDALKLVHRWIADRDITGSMILEAARPSPMTLAAREQSRQDTAAAVTIV